MKIKIFLFFLLCFSSASNSQIDQTKIDSLANVNLKATNTIGAYISIAGVDSVLISSGYGYNDLASGNVITDSTVFPISSNTKAFNSILLSQLAEKNKLNFYKPIIDYLPGLQFKDEYITTHVSLIDLLTHRVGIPRYDFTYYILNASEKENANESVVKKLKYLNSSVPFRTGFQYGNNQYILAAYLHEQLTGEKWETSLKQNILDPLGMKDTHAELQNFKNDQSRSLAYQDSIPVNIDHVAPMYEVSGMGNMFSTVRDLQKWGEFLVTGNDSIISKEYLDFNFRGHFSIGYEEPYPGFSGLQYGLGWFIFDYFGHKVVMHHGDNIGHQSLIFLLPDDKLSGVIMANNAFGKRSFPFTTLFGILDMVTGQKLNDWNKLMPLGRDFVPKYPDSLKVEQDYSLKDLKEFTGIYEHPGFGEIEIYLDNSGGLMLKAGHFVEELEAYAMDAFRCTAEIFDEDYIFEFKRSNAEVVSLKTDLIERTQPLIKFEKSRPSEGSK